MPIGAEVQVLQSCVLQADVLQDVPRTLTLWREAETDAAKRKERETWQREKQTSVGGVNTGHGEGSLSLLLINTHITAFSPVEPKPLLSTALTPVLFSLL